MASQDEQPSFEQAFNELRDTVQALETGNLSLEEATKLFDKGMKLAKVCENLLSTTELQVSRLQRSFGEQMPMIPTPEASASSEPDQGDG